MSSTRPNLSLAILACAGLVAQAGCTAPRGAPIAQAEVPNPISAVQNDSSVVSPPGPTVADEELDLAAVLDKLQQIRTIDPAAEQVLLGKLRDAPPRSWPLISEQFRASLAYREQLAAKNGESERKTELGLAGIEPSAPQSFISTTGAISAATEDSVKPVGYERELAQQAAERTTPSDDVALERNVRPVNWEGATRHDSFEIGVSKNPAPTSPPLAPIAEKDWRELVDEAAEKLSREVAASPASAGEIQEHVSLRFLRLVAGDTEKALEPLPNISPVEQDYWSKQLFALATFLDHQTLPDDKRRAAASVIHLDDAVSHLREQGSLSLRNLAFCKAVYGYGSIEPYEKDRFAPGDELSLYVEVENYHSRSTEKGFSTLLGSTYEVLDENGKRVDGGEFPDVDDCCRSRRRDFHIQYGLTLPAKLAPGSYRLQVVVKDRQSDKIGSASVPFEIRAN